MSLGAIDKIERLEVYLRFCQRESAGSIEAETIQDVLRRLAEIRRELTKDFDVMTENEKEETWEN